MIVETSLNNKYILSLQSKHVPPATLETSPPKPFLLNLCDLIVYDYHTTLAVRTLYMCDLYSRLVGFHCFSYDINLLHYIHPKVILITC